MVCDWFVCLRCGLFVIGVLMDGFWALYLGVVVCMVCFLVGIWLFVW